MSGPRRVACVVLTGFLFSLPFVFSQQEANPANVRPELMASNAVSIRVTFGLTDGEPRAWDGKLTVKSGDLLGLRNARPRPGDQVKSADWKLSTKAGVNFTLRAWEAESLTGPVKYLNHPMLVIDAKGTPSTEVAIETVNGSFTLRPFDMVAGSPMRVLDGAVSAERVATASMVSSTGSDNDFPSLASMPSGRLMAAWVSFAGNRTRIVTREFDGTSWSALQTLPSNHDDIRDVKISASRNGKVTAVWSAQVNGNWDLYASTGRGSNWSAPERLTSQPQPDVFPAVTTDSAGNVWVAWMGFRSGKSDIFVRSFDGSSWSAEQQVSSSAANDWAPAMAADSKGRVYVAWDSYDKGNYDVLFRKFENGRWSEVSAIANTPKYEANVSIACDGQDRLWAAWNEAGMDWGKDTGFLPRKQGTALYESRTVAVAVNDGQRWMEPAASLEAALPAALRGYNDMPTVSSDSNGRVWVFFRHRNLRIKDTPALTPAHRGAWEIHATTFDENGWRRPMPIPFSQGRLDMRMGLAASSGSLFAAWPMDNREFEEMLYDRVDVYASRLPLPAGAQGSLKLTPRVQPELKSFPTHYEEVKDLTRIHSYNMQSAGKTYRIYRGDTHRHTEFSMDGNNDGSLIDTYRYAIDAAELDFLLVSDHNGAGGPDKPYVNWLLQQTADIFTISGKFLPFYGYERSVVYPNGHRNIIFTKRGNPTLPIPESENKGETGAKMLYEYLKKYDGIAISHTSASTMGTDWRDNDPNVEPLVEIYQGDRVSAEYEGAPKAAHAGNPASAPGGFRPAGYVWNAWAKGYKLGIQAASDHLSTHISYACTLAEDFTREGLVNAMKQRHSYGATDNIILDYRVKAASAEHLQGDVAAVKGPFELHVKALGTKPIRQIDIIRNNQFVMTKNPQQQEVEFTFRDSAALAGESYYYVRVIQVDDQMAWSSPIWVKR